MGVIKYISLPEEKRKKIDDSIRKERVYWRKKITEAYNDLINSIVELKEVTNPTKEDINELVGHFNMTVMPKDFKKKMLDALNPDKCKGVPLYGDGFTEEMKDLKTEIKDNGKDKNASNTVKKLRRLVLMNLLTEFGFTKEMRIKLGKDNLPDDKGQVPDDPTVDNITDDTMWQAYVKSLSGVPNLERDKWSTLGGALKGAFDEAKSDQWKKIAFWKDLAEKKTWGEGKNGSILFASGDNTYQMKNDELKVVTPLTSDIKHLSNANATLDNKDKKTLQGFIEKLQKAMLKY